MSRFDFSQVDVFTQKPLQGNALAVVHGADELTDAQMQAIAQWTNLSETSFLLRPTDAGADYRVRIFTPGGELPFAGHPTLGSCHAWLQAGGLNRSTGWVVQQCGIGLVRIRIDADALAFAAPPLTRLDVSPEELAPVVAALGLAPSAVLGAQWLNNGPVWMGLLLGGADAVLRLEPDHARLKHLPMVGVAGSHAPRSECQFELRAFAASHGINEDPVTGSLNASMAEWLMDCGIAPASYVAAQGARVGRAGRVTLSRDAQGLWVGGHSVSCIRGQLTL